jgi:parvulin-like peptidyl-prolyl isomerase
LIDWLPFPEAILFNKLFQFIPQMVDSVEALNSPVNSFISSEEIVGFLKKNLQFREICRQILYQRIIDQAADTRAITITPEEIQTEADHLRRDLKLEKAADTLAWLTEQLINIDDWEGGIADRLLTQKLKANLFTKEVDVFFAQNRLDFEQILLYQIIVPYEKLAQELFYQIEEREISFYEAAHLYNIDERRRHECGYEGKLYRWTLKPEIAAVIFAADAGELIQPIQDEEGYHLLMVEEFIPATLTEEIRQNIQQRLFQEWLVGELNYVLHSGTVNDTHLNYDQACLS